MYVFYLFIYLFVFPTTQISNYLFILIANKLS